MQYVSTLGKTLMTMFQGENGSGLQVGRTVRDATGLPPGQVGGSFAELFSLIDGNLDLNLDAEELGAMSRLYLDGLMSSRDVDGDGLLTGEETGVPAEALSGLDSDGNGLDGSELNTLADELLGGIIRVLDRNEDNALSLKELALLFFIFGGGESGGVSGGISGATTGETSGDTEGGEGSSRYSESTEAFGIPMRGKG